MLKSCTGTFFFWKKSSSILNSSLDKLVARISISSFFSLVLSLLGYDSSHDTNLKTITTTAYANIMDVADDPSLQLYSSVKIQKLGSSETLTVNIVTPENITKVTSDMYRNAAVTLGIEHAAITVASPIPVTGESALAGIYYSLEENGAKVSDESKQLAQEELNTLSTINSENQGTDGYDADKLNVALADIKSAVADAGSDVTKDEVRQIVDDTLENYKLKDVLSNNQINMIVNFAFNLSNSNIINSSSFKSALSSLKDSIVSNAGSSFKGINLNFEEFYKDFYKDFTSGVDYDEIIDEAVEFAYKHLEERPQYEIESLTNYENMNINYV